MGAWSGLIWLRIGQVAGNCKLGNETSVSIKCGEFLIWEPVSSLEGQCSMQYRIVQNTRTFTHQISNSPVNLLKSRAIILNLLHRMTPWSFCQKFYSHSSKKYYFSFCGTWLMIMIILVLLKALVFELSFPT